MYEDKKVSANWFKNGLKIISVVLILLVIVKVVDVVRSNNSNVVENDKMKEKITILEKAGKKYFTDDLLPKDVGDSKTVTLAELIDKKLTESITNEKNEDCDIKKSYVKVTKLDQEYQVKSYLLCPGYEDFINSIILIDNNKNDDKKTTTTTTKKAVTTKKTTKKTTVKKVQKHVVSFNTNGGSLIDSQDVLENGLIASPSIPIRAGYKFVGWYYHGNPFDMNTKITHDYVLVAKWIKA